MMHLACHRQINVLAQIIEQFDLSSLQPTLAACQTLSGGGPIDVAVLGQFKSGKSSLLNAVLGEAVFPVGVVPVTAVITRAAAGPEKAVHVTYLEGSVEKINPERLVDYVTETGNPHNQRHVAVVDVLTPALRDWPGMRLVDTPGLGSVFAHNTEATRTWMPNVAVGLVTVSAERPLADEDRRLIAEARQTAPRVVVLLTKVDLLTETDLQDVRAFLDRALRDHFGIEIPVLPFSSRVEPEQWVHRLRDEVLRPVANNVAEARQLTLTKKLDALASACRGYLSIGQQAAERVDADRERLRKAVFTETVNASVIRDELRLAKERICADTRPSFTSFFFEHRPALEQRVKELLSAALRTWQGNLANQARRYETWMTERLTAELTPLSEDAVPLADEWLGRAEERLRRVVEAFRDRIGRNVQEATGINITPITWEVKRPEMVVVPVALSQTFMTPWELLWWLLPMKLVGGLFRRHVLGRVRWEVEKNLMRLAGDWAETVNQAVTGLRDQASAWVDAELATLGRLVGQQQAEAAAFRVALQRLDQAGLQEARTD